MDRARSSRPQAAAQGRRRSTRRAWPSVALHASAAEPSAASPRVKGRGQSLVELSIATPLMLLLMLGTIDVGRLFFGYIEMTNAVREGAGYGAHNPDKIDNIKARVSGHASDLPASSIGVTCTGGCDQGDEVTVSATWTFVPLYGPFFSNFFPASGLGSISLATQNTVKIL